MFTDDRLTEFKLSLPYSVWAALDEMACVEGHKSREAIIMRFVAVELASKKARQIELWRLYAEGEELT